MNRIFALVIILLYVCMPILGESDKTIINDYKLVIKGFSNIFFGEWVKLPVGDSIPEEVLIDSKYWANQALDDKCNPYIKGKILDQVFWLGKGLSPDKLVTVVSSEIGRITIIETKQKFIVEIKDVKFSENITKTLDILQEKARKYFSTKALPCINTGIKESLFGKPVYEQSKDFSESTEPLLLSNRPIPSLAENYHKWNDGTNIMVYKGNIYLYFYKVTEYAIPIYIKQGLDWESETIKQKYNIPIRPIKF